MWKKIIISLFAASLLFVAYLSCADIVNPFPPSDTTIHLSFINSKGKTTTTELFTDTVGKTVTMKIVPYLYSNIDSLNISIVNRANNIPDTVFKAEKLTSDLDTFTYKFIFKTTGTRVVRASAEIMTIGKKEITSEFSIVGKLIQFSSQPKVVKASETERANFNVKMVFDSTQTLSYKWLKDGKIIPNATNDSLIINSVSVNDAGSYICIVKNQFNDSAISSAGALFVNASSSSIKITSQPTSIAVAEGAKAVLGISIENADPTYSYYWLQNGIVKAGETKDSLIINAVSQSDTGSYICVVKKGSDSTTSSVANLSISSLAPSNHAPKLEVKGLLNILIDKPCSLSLSATDADAGQTVAYSLGFGPKDGVLTADKFVWTPASGFTGTDSVLFIAKDNGTPPLSDSVKVVITVSKSIPLPDSVSGITAVSRKNGVFTFKWTKAANADMYIIYRSTTVDGTFLVIDTTSETQFSDSAKTVSYYYVKAMNQMGTSNASEKVSSAGINTAPKWQKDTIAISGQQNVPLSLNLANSVLDANGDAITLKLISGAPASATLEGLVFKFTPSATDVGPYTVKLGAYDGIDSSFATMILTFSSTNKSPAITKAPDTTINETQVLALKLIAVDPDGTTPIMSATSLDGSALPTGATFAPATGIFAWTPTIGQAGVYKIMFSATDGTLTDKDTVVITVGKTNRPPVLSGATDVNVAVGAPVNFTVTATDPDADKVTITTSTLPTGATFTAATGVFDWKPTATQTGAFKVTFTATDGKLPVTKEITITISNNPAPKVTVDPVSVTLCAGGADTLSITATAAGTITYQWQQSGKDVAGATKNVLVLSKVDVTDTGSYTCVVTNDGGKVTSKGAKVTINTLTVAPTSISGTTTICSGTSTTLKVVGGVLGTGATDWNWYSDKCGGTSVGKGTSFTTPNLTQNTTYYVGATGTCNTVCTKVDVTVNETPAKPTVTVPAAVCAGSPVTINASTTTSGATIKWNTKADFSGSDVKMPVSPGAGKTTYYARAEKGSCVSQSVPVDATVNAIPGKPTGVSASAASVCSGSQVTLSATVNAGEVKWYTSTTSTSAVGTGTGFKPTITGNMTYYARGENSGCNGPWSDAVSVGLNTASVAPTKITIDQSSTTVCSGFQVKLTVGDGKCGDGAQWKWYTGTCGGTAVSGGTGASITQTINSETTYFVRAEGGCSGNTSCASIKLSTYGNPSIKTSPTDVTVDDGKSATFSVVAQGGNPSKYTYQWRKGNTNLAGANSASYTISKATSGDDQSTYSCMVTDACTKSSTWSSAGKLIVKPIVPTKPSITGSSTICTGGEVTLTANTQNANYYKWYSGKCGGDWVAEGASSKTIKIKPNGSKDYFVVAYNGSVASECSPAFAVDLLYPQINTKVWNQNSDGTNTFRAHLKSECGQIFYSFCDDTGGYTNWKSGGNDLYTDYELQRRTYPFNLKAYCKSGDYQSEDITTAP